MPPSISSSPPPPGELIAGRFRIISLTAHEGTTLTFDAQEEVTDRAVTLISGDGTLSPTRDPAIESPARHYPAIFARYPHLVAAQELISHNGIRYVVSERPRGQRLTTLTSSLRRPLSTPSVLRIAASLWWAIHAGDEIGRSLFLGIAPEHVWIDHDQHAQLGGLVHSLVVCNLVGGWGGFSHSPPDIVQTVEDAGIDLDDLAGILRAILAAELDEASPITAARNNWHRYAQVVGWMGLAGEFADHHSFGDRIRSARPDFPTDLAEILTGLLRPDLASRDPFIAALPTALGLQLPVVTESQPEPESSPPALTARELEVLRHLTDGLTNQQIATRLDVSRHTVDRHVRNLYRKLGVTRRVEAWGAASRWGFLESP
jgi:DNA-binding CsgD family transcriptional regulator